MAAAAIWRANETRRRHAVNLVTGTSGRDGASTELSQHSCGAMGALIRTFLSKVEQIAFQGFHSADYPSVGLERPIFWRAELVGAVRGRLRNLPFKASTPTTSLG